MKGAATVPFSVLGEQARWLIDTAADEDAELEVSFDFTPGQAPSGEFGPPEHYDPGSGDEFEEVFVTYRGIPQGISGDGEERIVNWLAENWEPDEPDYPEPDYD